MAAKPYAVVREVVVDAPPAEVHAHVNDFHRWVAWSPWEGLDPAMKRTFTGPEAGVGAAYTWDGNKKAGAGSMTITNSTPEVINIDLEFSRPFPADNQTEFRFRPEGRGTRVSWTMHGELNGLMKLVSLVFSMDKLMGPDFTKGLTRLKAVVEAER